MIYLFHGDDSFSSKAKLEKQIRNFKQKYGADNVTTFRESDTDLAHIISSICDSSLFSEKRMVVLENQLERSGPEQKEIIASLSRKDSDTYVLIHESVKIKKDHAVFAVIPDHSQIFELSREGQNNNTVLQELLSELNITIDKNAAAKIISSTNNNLFAASQMIRQIAASIFPERHIGEIHLKNIPVMQGHQTSAFDIANMIVQKRKKEALKAFGALSHDGEADGILSGPIPYQIRTMIIAKAAQAEKIPNEKVLKDFKMKPYSLTKAQQLSRVHNIEDLTLLLNNVAKADIASKSSTQKTDALFEHILLGL